MKKIVTFLKPFTLLQDVLVFENNECIDKFQANIDTLSETIFRFSDGYDIIQVDLIGPTQYSAGIKKRIQKEEILKYNTNKLQIEVI